MTKDPASAGFFLPDAARSNTVKQLDRRNRGTLKCKYMLFLVQISMQMHMVGLPLNLSVFAVLLAN
jgi:hypothetical protein